jgi:hypothetical protein
MCDARRHTGPAFNRTTEGTPSEASSTADRRGQTGAGGASTPLTPTAARPSLSTSTDGDATTSPAATDNTARTVARAILSTLDTASAVFVLATLATFARTIVDAAALLRQSPGDSAEATARAMLAAALDAFDARAPGDVDPSTHTYALAAAWWFATPRDTAATFWRDDIARANVEDQARAALVDVEALRAALHPVEGESASPPSMVPLIRLPMPAAGDGSGLLSQIARALYYATPSQDGYGDVASGLAALVGNHADGEDAMGLVCGLSQLAHLDAGDAAESLKVDSAKGALLCALERLDVAAAVARHALAAFEAHDPNAAPYTVKVRAA